MLQEMLSFIMAINAIDGLILNRKTNDYSFIYYSVKRKGLYNVKFSNTFQIPATNFFSQVFKRFIKLDRSVQKNAVG